MPGAASIGYPFGDAIPFTPRSHGLCNNSILMLHTPNEDMPGATTSQRRIQAQASFCHTNTHPASKFEPHPMHQSLSMAG